MATNLAIDQTLLEKALTLGGHRTKRATVNEALTEYVQRRLRLEAVAHFGTFDFDPEYDHKKARGSASFKQMDFGRGEVVMLARCPGIVQV